ncbi:TPA: hypothetical protein HA361_02180 [Candidatus Woesearchaeota archaeon]|nr:hypothetical protein [Candidatus Woesearchaeota archaeon]HII68571.1 hypothetical protein [Candidatus Woesearchaeota archaeon]
MMCSKCSKITGVLVLVAGILFLLVDIGFWKFFDLSWYTVVFLLLGLVGIASASCKDCQKCSCGEDPAPKSAPAVKKRR